MNGIDVAAFRHRPAHDNRASSQIFVTSSDSARPPRSQLAGLLKRAAEGQQDIFEVPMARLRLFSRSTSNGRTNPNSTSSSHPYVFLASRAGSEILYRSPSFGECPTLVAFEPLQLGEDVNQRSALFRSTIPLGSNPGARKDRLQFGSSANELAARYSINPRTLGERSQSPMPRAGIDATAGGVYMSAEDTAACLPRPVPGGHLF
jgi:hypothetical protein